MTAQVRLFAGAAEAVGREAVAVEATTVAEVLATLTALGGLATADVLSRCAIVVAGTRADSPDTPVPPGALVDVLPPFAGG